MRRAIFCLFPPSLWLEWRLMYSAWSGAVAANQRRLRNRKLPPPLLARASIRRGRDVGGIKLNCGRAHRLSHSWWWKVIKVQVVFIYKVLLTNRFVTTCSAERWEKLSELKTGDKTRKDEKKSARRCQRHERPENKQLSDPQITSRHLSFCLWGFKRGLWEKTRVFGARKSRRTRKAANQNQLQQLDRSQMLLCWFVWLFGVKGQTYCSEQEEAVLVTAIYHC